MNDSDFLLNFMLENINSGGISKEISDEVKLLWNEYKKDYMNKNDSIITCDFGNLGSLVIRDVSVPDVKFISQNKLKYQSGSYDFVSIRSDKTKRILWTDYQDIEPYNRQSGLYCDGASFDMLGEPVYQCSDYREFNVTDNYLNNISFAIWGYSYNDFYKSIEFGLVIEKDKVDEFIIKLRKIIGK